MKYEVKKLAWWIRSSQFLVSAVGLLSVLVLVSYAAVYAWNVIYVKDAIDFNWWPIVVLVITFIVMRFLDTLIDKTLILDYYSHELSEVKEDLYAQIIELRKDSGNLRPPDEDKISIFGEFEKDHYLVSEVKAYIVEGDSIRELTYLVAAEKLYLDDEFVFPGNMEKFLF